MKNLALRSFLVASTIALAIPFAAQARPMGGHGHAQCDGGAMSMQAERGMFGGDKMPRMLRGLNLTEAQQDQIFKMMHEQQPTMREKAKEMRAARKEMRDMMMSDNYDEAKVKTLTERSAQAMAEMAQMRARGASEVYKLLTPEQRKTLEERKTRMQERMKERMEKRGDRMEKRGDRSQQRGDRMAQLMDDNSDDDN